MSSTRMRTPINTAWLRDHEVGRYLRVRARAVNATPGTLSFFAPEFALNQPDPWLIGDECDSLADLVPSSLPELTHRVDPSAAEFDRVFEDITKRVLGGEFQKVVPIVHEDVRFAEPLDARMFPRAWAVPPRHQWAYGFCFDDEGLAGVTPETLFSVKDGVLSTMALAGTGPAEGPALLDDDKECREHRLVIDHVGAELKRWGSPRVGATIERTYGQLKHLFTPMDVRLDRAPDFMELVVALHPTAALGGYPRRPAVEWLERQAFHVTRRRFGAPFGFVDGETFHCVVAIRGVQWRGRDLMIAAGCGVVDGSRVEREWRELELKRAAIYRNLGMEL